MEPVGPSPLLEVNPDLWTCVEKVNTYDYDLENFDGDIYREVNAHAYVVVGHRAVHFSCRFLKPPRAGEVLPNFSTKATCSFFCREEHVWMICGLVWPLVWMDLCG